MAESLLEHPEVAALLAKIEEVASCQVVTPLVPGVESVTGRCAKQMPCPDHGAAMLERLGFNPNIRQQEGPSVSISDSEPGTDIGAQPPTNDDDTQEQPVTQIDADQVVVNNAEDGGGVDNNADTPDSEATDADES